MTMGAGGGGGKTASFYQTSTHCLSLTRLHKRLTCSVPLILSINIIHLCCLGSASSSSFSSLTAGFLHHLHLSFLPLQSRYESDSRLD